MTPDLNSHPRLAPGCRLNEKNQQPRTLLMPERALRLNGPSLEIVERCDGQHTVQQIITEWQQRYSRAEPAKVQEDILGYLALLEKERALDFEPRHTSSVGVVHAVPEPGLIASGSGRFP